MTCGETELELHVLQVPGYIAWVELGTTLLDLCDDAEDKDVRETAGKLFNILEQNDWSVHKTQSVD